jgi:uncharacterized membrane protein YhaH (DUF805 family)
MGLGHYLFGFSGRINRAKQWAIILVGLALEVLVFIAVRLTVGTSLVADLISGKTTLGAFIATPQAHMAGIILCLFYILLLYIALAVATKRLHDRNKSAWWLLIFYALPFILGIPRMMVTWNLMQHIDDVARTVQHGGTIDQGGPLAILAGGASSLISLWAFVELFCLRGTVGDNRYGPDPLAAKVSTP